MTFNDHSHLEGLHAYLSPSKYYWCNYDPEKLEVAYRKHIATQRGTRLHEYACESIRLGIKLPKTKQTLNMYVNDAIGFRMTPEQPLYYSNNCFGTTDAICFRQKTLRIHDLKTGSSLTSMKQLEIYAAIFCLEYSEIPEAIELRIYQNDQIIVHSPSYSEIKYMMNKIIEADKQIEFLKGDIYG